jgi:septal ring factor EnvC (AmiA/AmiB activator)
MCTTPGCNSKWERRFFLNECPECMFDLGRNGIHEEVDAVMPLIRSSWHVNKVNKLQTAEAKLEAAEAKLKDTEAKLQATEAKLKDAEAKRKDAEAQLQTHESTLKAEAETLRQILNKPFFMKA